MILFECHLSLNLISQFHLWSDSLNPYRTISTIQIPSLLLNVNLSYVFHLYFFLVIHLLILLGLLSTFDSLTKFSQDLALLHLIQSLNLLNLYLISYMDYLVSS